MPGASTVQFFTPLPLQTDNGLAAALIASSRPPLLLLDGDLHVTAVSRSFCESFQLDRVAITGKGLAEFGRGEWGSRQLDGLLRATASGHAAVEAYEMELVRAGMKTCHLVVNAYRLDLGDDGETRVALAVTDVTQARHDACARDTLIREKQILYHELQHRVANSLQIIASVLMQSARRVQSEETRLHLHDAHHRVMSIATLQKQLAASAVGDVELRGYFTDLCRSITASMIADHDRIVLRVTADDTRTTSEVSVSLGLIVTELVINALKHAFPGRNQRGIVTVDYTDCGNGWALTVTDDGVGMPGDHASVKPGLGTGIVDALAKQLDATVIVANGAPGTRVSLVHTGQPGDAKPAIE